MSMQPAGDMYDLREAEAGLSARVVVPLPGMQYLYHPRDADGLLAKAVRDTELDAQEGQWCITAAPVPLCQCGTYIIEWQGMEAVA